MSDIKKAKTGSDYAQKELDKAEENFQKFDDSVKELTLDRMNAAPVLETEAQTKLSQKEIQNSKDTYLKPKRSISGRDRFNEKFRKNWEFDKEYVKFIAENKEIIGETIDLWTKPYGGVPAEEWEVPTNKPVWGPRYLAEQIKRCRYHRLRMEDRPVSSEGAGTFYGHMVADNVVQRLDAHPVADKKSIFMSSGF